MERSLGLASFTRDDASSSDASSFPEFHDRGIVEVLFGGAFDVIVGFARGGGGGKGNAQLIGKVQGEAEVLVHEAQGKTRDVFPFEKIRRFYVEDAGARHAGLQDFDQYFTLNASASDEGQGFGEGVHLQSEDEVHGQLDGLPGTIRAEMK